MDSVEGQDEIEFFGAIECGRVLLLVSHVGQPVTVCHEPRGVERRRLIQLEAHESAGREPPCEQIKLGPPPTADVGDVDTFAESLGDPGNERQNVINRHGVNGVQVIGLVAGPQFFVRLVRHPSPMAEVIDDPILDLAQHGDVLTHSGHRRMAHRGPLPTLQRRPVAVRTSS